MSRKRFTVAFDDESIATMNKLGEGTALASEPIYIRTAVAVLSDLLDVMGRDLKIVFRDTETGREWQYSPHKPGSAQAVVTTEANDNGATFKVTDSVFEREKGRRPGLALVVGERAYLAVKEDENSVAIPKGNKNDPRRPQVS